MRSSVGPTDLRATTPTRFRHGPRWVPAALTCILCLHVILSCIGITWGLPSRKIDPFLFGDGEVWSGEKIHRLAHAGDKFSADRLTGTGADVDVDPLGIAPKGPVLLTAKEEDVAKIYLRYRLYTYQPDEMITMMALAGMRPGELQFDPRLYQYGGLFIYPVGALIKLCGMLGLIDVRSDIVFYLDHPEEFGKFYVVARAYSAAWGLVGVIVVFALTRRFAMEVQRSKVEGGALEEGTEARRHGGTQASGSFAGLVAALLFTLMPVVVCMSHEGKPHLPGAVLMLLGVYLAIRSVHDNRQSTIDNRKFFWLMCVCCSAAVGMVLSSWPICVLIPMAAIFQSGNSNRDGIGTQAQRHEGTKGSWATALNKTFLGGLTAVAVYFLTNPYVLINFFVNRDVLRSNFGNSLAMYEVSRIAEGLERVLCLTDKGATLPVMLGGMTAVIIGLTTSVRKTKSYWLLVLPAGLFFTQFVLIGAGKPAEYGRFGIFTDSVLAIAVAILLASIRLRSLAHILVAVVLISIAYDGIAYCNNFYVDTTESASRLHAARDELLLRNDVDGMKPTIHVPVEPAPYCCPPLNFAASKVVLAREEALQSLQAPFLMIHVVDRPFGTPISWANKMIILNTSVAYRTWQWPVRLE